jgi:hypothetical protein
MQMSLAQKISVNAMKGNGTERSVWSIGSAIHRFSIHRAYKRLELKIHSITFSLETV